MNITQYMETHGHENCVNQYSRAAEKQSLAREHGDDAEITGIAHILEHASGYQALRGRNRRRRAVSFPYKPGKKVTEERYGDQEQSRTQPSRGIQA